MPGTLDNDRIVVFGQKIYDVETFLDPLTVLPKRLSVGTQILSSKTIVRSFPTGDDSSNEGSTRAFAEFVDDWSNECRILRFIVKENSVEPVIRG